MDAGFWQGHRSSLERALHKMAGALRHRFSSKKERGGDAWTSLKQLTIISSPDSSVEPHSALFFTPIDCIESPPHTFGTNTS